MTALDAQRLGLGPIHPFYSQDRLVVSMATQIRGRQSMGNIKVSAMALNELDQLAIRIEMVSGWDADLELEIFRALGIPVETVPRRLCEVTRSIDAVEALRRRIIPDGFIEVQYMPRRGACWSARISPCSDVSTAVTEPRARLAAVLRAVSALADPRCHALA